MLQSWTWPLSIGSFLLPAALILGSAAGRGNEGKETGQAPDLGEVGRKIVDATNRFRQKQHLQPLKANSKLDQAARDFADYLARTGKFSHTADGKEPSERIQAQAYTYCIVAENIAYEYSATGFTAEELARRLMAGWEQSPEHRKNLLDPDVTEIGVGVARSPKTGRYYAVQDFTRPKAKEIRFTLTNQTDGPIQYRLGDKSYSVPARFERIHMLCRPAELRVELPGPAGEGSKQTKILRPEPKAAYLIRQTDSGQYTVDKR